MRPLPLNPYSKNPQSIRKRAARCPIPVGQPDNNGLRIKGYSRPETTSFAAGYSLSKTCRYTSGTCGCETTTYGYTSTSCRRKTYLHENNHFARHPTLFMRVYRPTASNVRAKPFGGKQKKAVPHSLYKGSRNGFCDLGGILTLDLQNRNLTLYTAKLRGLTGCKSRHNR